MVSNLSDMSSIDQLARNDARRVVAASALLVALCVIIFAYRGTFVSIVDLWLQSETFTHGFAIVPLSLWLIWRRGADLERAVVRPSVVGLMALVGVVLIWLVARVTHVQLVQQLAAMALAPATILAIAGPAATRMIAFPLAYLIFAVPFGENLIPHLMRFTAAFAVHALNLTGIPVFRDGMYFSIPGGDFEVARACSGIRYLIASTALGTLYAYLTYTKHWKRALFIVVSALTPVVANGLRAYIIVMLAHLTDMRIAVGVDHFIYGWLFFGIVMFLLFAVGSFFRDPEGGGHAPDENRMGDRELGGIRPLATTGSLVLLIILAGPALAYRAQQGAASRDPIVAALPVTDGSWRGPQTGETDWNPIYYGEPQIRYGRYPGPAAVTEVYLISYTQQTQDAELVNWRNRLYDDVTWDQLEQRPVSAAGHTVVETLIRRGRSERVIWHWYEVGERSLIDERVVKLAEAWQILSGARGTASLVAVSLPVEDDRSNARRALADFLDRVGPALIDCARAGAGSRSGCVAQADP